MPAALRSILFRSSDDDEQIQGVAIQLLCSASGWSLFLHPNMGPAEGEMETWSIKSTQVSGSLLTGPFVAHIIPLTAATDRTTNALPVQAFNGTETLN